MRDRLSTEYPAFWHQIFFSDDIYYAEIVALLNKKKMIILYAQNQWKVGLKTRESCL